MALTNIELYEALKKELSEDSARMIAEVVPQAGELVTFDQLRAELVAVEQRLERRIAALERRFFLFFALPLWGAVGAGIVKYLMS